MDVHKPKAAHSWREFAVEIGTVTIGILIALSLEALVEHARTHALVEHARADLRAELTSARRGVSETLASSIDAERGAAELADLVEAQVKDRPPPPKKSVSVNMVFHNVNTGAWESTVATQALSHMPFAEARALSEAYGDIRSFDDFEHEAERQWFTITALDLSDDVDKPELRRQLGTLKLNQAYARGVGQSGRQTLASIDEALAALDGRAAPLKPGG